MQLRTVARLVQVPISSGAQLRLSIVIPVYNGAATIASLVQTLVDHNPGYDLQIVLVNDGSVDGSRNACLSVAVDHPGLVTFVDLSKHVGEQNAVIAGLAHATGDYCVIVDDDFQNPPGEAYRLADEANRAQRDVVFCSCGPKQHNWFRHAGSRLVNAMSRRLLGLPDGLYLSSLKCLSRFVVEQVLSYRGPSPHVDALALRATRNIGLVRTEHAETRRTKAGYTLFRLLNLWRTMAVSFSVHPLRTATVLGMFLSLAVAGVVIEKIHGDGATGGWSSPIVAVLVLSGVQFLLLGIIGEYVGQLVLRTSGTPRYVVRQVVAFPRNSDEIS